LPIRPPSFLQFDMPVRWLVRVNSSGYVPGVDAVTH
jgi:hypothetical protein